MTIHGLFFFLSCKIWVKFKEEHLYQEICFQITSSVPTTDTTRDPITNKKGECCQGKYEGIHDGYFCGEGVDDGYSGREGIHGV